VSKPSVRDTVLRSLSAVGATQEAQYYADLFSAQAPERFAFIVLDPRCLKNPLLEALISNLLILSELKLYPILLIGALDDDRTKIKFLSRRLVKELESVSIRTTKLDTESYGLLPEIRKSTQSGVLPILEMLNRREPMTLDKLITEIKPNKVIFLQPSGGLSVSGQRIGVVKIENMGECFDQDDLSFAQSRFVKLVRQLTDKETVKGRDKRVYVIASPLNLLGELFTTRGSGTMFRHGAKMLDIKEFEELDIPRLRSSIEGAFEKPLRDGFFEITPQYAFIEADYRGGAIFTGLAGLPYLSKFWVTHEARGEGIARDIWEHMCQTVPAFFWRSRMGNPFNDWYMRHCDGMQVSGDWRVFWMGLAAPEVPSAILAAASAPDDFTRQ